VEQFQFVDSFQRIQAAIRNRVPLYSKPPISNRLSQLAELSILLLFLSFSQISIIFKKIFGSQNNGFVKQKAQLFTFWL